MSIKNLIIDDKSTCHNNIMEEEVKTKQNIGANQDSENTLRFRGCTLPSNFKSHGTRVEDISPNVEKAHFQSPPKKKGKLDIFLIFMNY